MTRTAFAAVAHGLDAMSSTANEQGARLSAIRGASPHVAVQHHSYFVVISMFLFVIPWSLSGRIVQCMMRSRMRGSPALPTTTSMECGNSGWSVIMSEVLSDQGASQGTIRK